MTTTRKVQLAYDVLSMAESGNMPDSFWFSDQRIARACEVLSITPRAALQKKWSAKVLDTKPS